MIALPYHPSNAVSIHELQADPETVLRRVEAFIADAALAIVVTADPLASDVWIEDASIASITFGMMKSPFSMPNQGLQT